MQAIVTKFIGPTNHRGARILASCEAGKLTVSWDYALSVEPNHHAAAVALAEKLGWTTDAYGQLVSGGLPGAGYCHVFVRGGVCATGTHDNRCHCGQRVCDCDSCNAMLPGDDIPVPPCAASMGCLCAGHARGNDATAACDTRETA